MNEISEFEIVNSTGGAKIKRDFLLPFKYLTEGKSFFVPKGMYIENSLRALCSNMSKKYNKNFKCHTSKSKEYYEVACLPIKERVTMTKLNLFDIVPSSPEVLETPIHTHESEINFPFEQLEEGFSFIVNYGIIPEEILRKIVLKESKKLKIQFKLIKHEQYQLFEVARIITPKFNVVQSSPESYNSQEGNEYDS